MTLWLYLHFESLQLDTLFSDVGDSPVIIIHGRKNEVWQLNQVASSAGIKAGMGLGTAASMCADLHVHPYDEEVEKKRLQEIAQWLYLVTSDITFFEPDGILLRISNMLSLYSGLDSYFASLKAHLDKLNVRYQYATGYSPLSARLLACAGLNVVTQDKDKLVRYLSQRPLSETELSNKTVEKLSKVGIRSLSDLIRMPMTEIAKRFDIDLVNYVGRLTGQFKHPVNFYHPPEQFSRYLELLFDIENLQWLEKPLNKVLLLLEDFLKIRDQLAYEISLTLHLRDSDDQDIAVASASGDFLAAKWLSLLKLKLESVKIDSPVTGITLRVVRLADRYAEKAALFDGKRGAQSADELISVLKAKLGDKAVCGLAITEDARPQFANQLCEPAGNVHQIPINPNIVRPSMLLPSPQPLTEKVSIVRGPERVATGWWDGKPITRDYFVARSDKGQWLWVYRDRKQRWFVHGLFS